MRARSVLAAILCVAPILTVAACGWDPRRPFEREAPAVREAIHAFDAGDAGAAAMILEDYLTTGRCKEGAIGTPDIVKRRADGAFDLGLSLFAIGESYGGRFGDEEADAGAETRQLRGAQIACALALVTAIGNDDRVPIEVRARARYLEGNLHFLGSDYEEAVRAYDRALQLSPGQVDAGDPVGRDAAWNRAIALRRIEDKKDAGQDASPDSGNDGGNDASTPDSGKDDSGSGNDSGGNDSGGNDSGGDGGGGRSDGGDPEKQKADAGSDGGSDGRDAGDPNGPEAGAAPPPKASQDDRILDGLENAPTVQQEDAKRRAGRVRRGRGMADK